MNAIKIQTSKKFCSFCEYDGMAQKTTAERFPFDLQVFTDGSKLNRLNDEDGFEQ